MLEQSAEQWPFVVILLSNQIRVNLLLFQCLLLQSPLNIALNDKTNID